MNHYFEKDLNIIQLDNIYIILYIIMEEISKPSAKNCVLAIRITNLVTGYLNFNIRVALIGFGVFGIVFMAIN